MTIRQEFREFLKENTDKQLKELEKELGKSTTVKGFHRFIFTDGSYLELDLKQENDKRIGYYAKENDFISTFPNVKSALKYIDQSGLKLK